MKRNKPSMSTKYGHSTYKKFLPSELFEMVKWMLANGKHFGHLSASGFQSGGRPNLKAAIELGREERLEMRRAYEENK